MHRAFSAALVRVLRARGPEGESLVSAIRVGRWNTEFFRSVTEALEGTTPGKLSELDDDAADLVLAVFGVAFTQKDNWPFDRQSTEYQSLQRLVEALLRVLGL